MLQENPCHTILPHHQLDPRLLLILCRLRLDFPPKLRRTIMIPSFPHSIKIRLQAISHRLVYLIPSIPMRLHRILPVKPDPIPIISLNRPIHQPMQAIQQQHRLPIHGINQHIVPIRDLQVKKK